MKTLKVEKEQNSIVNVEKQSISKIILWYIHQKMKIVKIEKEQNSMLNVKN